MKHLIPYLLFFCIPLFTGMHVFAQCEPNTDCIDESQAVAFCPKNLPDGIIDEPYETVLTVVPPSMLELAGIPLNISYIKIDSVTNFPPGISYIANAEKFYGGTPYCVLISGTPTQLGTFTLMVYATLYINYPLLGVIKGPQVIDNTTIVLNIKNVTGIEFSDTKKLEVFQNAPNPFSHSTKIGFYTPSKDRINLKVYNISGKLIHEESRLVIPGEHFFNFDGSELLPGSYLYLVTSSTSYTTQKLIKTR